MIFGDKIRKIRISKGIKSKFVANKINMSPSSYCDIESGRKKLTLEHALIIADALGVDIKDFFYENKLRDSRDLPTGTDGK